MGDYRWRRPWLRKSVLTASAVTLAAATVALGGIPAANAATLSETFTYTGGEQTFLVPSNVTAVEVLAIGGSGGTGSEAGGVGAQVTGELAVHAGETLYVEVGGNGKSRGSGGRGGFNGGGNGGAGGGGASDVRTSPLTSGLFPDDRLLVAGGGGGGGENTSCLASIRQQRP